MTAWYENSGAQGDVVLSTRVRLARNIASLPFAASWSDASAAMVIGAVRDAVMGSAKKLGRKFEFLNLDNAMQNDKLVLVEDHLISHEMLQGKNKALLLSKEQDISIMLGEEDHIRLQVILPGLAIKEALALADRVDDAIGGKVEYAFDETFGYLTRCPTNVGTGLRASLMLHVPALKMTGRMNVLAGSAGKLGLTIRGMYGEGSDAKGDLFQLSNQITLGISEGQAAEKLEKVAMQMISAERQLRQKLRDENPIPMADRLYRALGTLRYARTMSSDECKHLLSEVKLGIHMGIINDIAPEVITRLMVGTEPAHINRVAGEVLAPEKRDELRGEMVRKALEASPN